MGLTEAGERERLREEARIVVALLTPAYLAEHESEIAALARRPAELLPVAFAALPGAGIHDLGPWRTWIIRENRPYDSHGPRDREQFVADVAAMICCLLDSTLESVSSAPGAALDDDMVALERVSRLTAASRRSADAKVDPRASEIGLDPASVGLAADGRLCRARGEAVLAVDRLVEWASSTGPDAPRLCALLGDLGMGKTTTAKLFTERLLGLRGEDPAVPVPVLFDLRDISVAALPAQPTLEAAAGRRRATSGPARRSGRPGCCSPAARITSGRSGTRSGASPARTGTDRPGATTWRCSCCRSARSRSGPTWPPTFRVWTWTPCWR
jgi:hypothetical protein